MKLENKVVLITGASRGIGKATALLFAKEGANVALNYLNNLSEVELVKKDIEAVGRRAIILQGDVSEEEQVKNIFTKMIEEFGHVDILVNNAGIVFDVPFMDKTVEQWKRTLDVNLIGQFLCAKYFAKNANSGRIINIASTNGVDSFNPDSIDYDASKAGIIIMTKDLAKGLAPNILVNSISPGWVNTDMNKELPSDFIKTESSKIYLKRFAEPEEVAKVALFLASDDSSFITGSNIIVDGGYGD